MCLAVPGKIVECDADRAIVDLQGNRLTINKVLTPQAMPGDWVLVHAGFAISSIDEKDALQTWDYLLAAYQPDLQEQFESATFTPNPEAFCNGP